MSVIFWDQKVQVRRLAFEEFRVVLAVCENRLSAKSTQFYIILICSLNKTFHLIEEIVYCVHIKIIPFSLVIVERRVWRILSVRLLYGDFGLHLVHIDALLLTGRSESIVDYRGQYIH